MSHKLPEELRSHRWYGVDNLRAFGHRSRTAQIGYDRADYLGKPVIAVLNTWSDINPCHSHLRQRVEEVKRGVWRAGGFPVEILLRQRDHHRARAADADSVSARYGHAHGVGQNAGRRKRLWTAPAQKFSRGYGALFSKHITRANEGCDFDFLEGTEPTPDSEIH